MLIRIKLRDGQTIIHAQERRNIDCGHCARILTNVNFYAYQLIPNPQWWRRRWFSVVALITSVNNVPAGYK